MSDGGGLIMKVLFVCLGNICRSPMAEGLMKKMIIKEGLQEKIQVESRGTSSYEIGESPHPKTQAILLREKAMLTNKRAQRISRDDFKTFDIIIGMDKQNVKDLRRIANDDVYKIYLFRDIDQRTQGEDIPDPYYTNRYEETFHLIQESLPLWLNWLKKS